MLTFFIVMIIVYEIYYLIQSRSITCVSLSGSTMYNLVDSMTKDNFVDYMTMDNFDTNIITHDRNIIIMISS